ncbi:MAG: VOC family protein [Betaproteobacteria bacterium]|nr:VOC family protein [Betaproteobacteria bacterium]
MKMTAPLEVGICVADLARAMAFYEGVLALKKISAIDLNEHGSQMSGLGTSGYRVVRLQTSYGERIKLVCPIGPPERPGPAATPSSRTGLAYVTFLVDDIDAMVKCCERAGSASVKGIVELRPGVRMALVPDPEGNFIEFAQYDSIGAYRPDLAC